MRSPDFLAELLLELRTPRLAELAPRVPTEAGRRVGIEGRRCDRLYLIAEGQVLLSRRDVRGNEHALYLLGPGEVFGVGALLPERRWLVNARAVTNGLLHALPGSHVATLAQVSPQLTAQLFALLAARVERGHQRISVMVQSGARERLLGLLQLLACYHGTSFGEDLWLPVPVTQSHLGQMVSLARETVARTLTDLESEGMIRRDGRRGFWLLRTACSELEQG